MTTIAFVSAKGSPGVTTTVLGIAATWLAGVDQVMVAECDPAGGDLAHRFSLSTERGIVSLVGDSGRDEVVLGEHVQTLPGGLRAIVSSPSAEQTTAALGRLAHHNPFADSGDVTVLIDCGRVDGRSQALPFVVGADFVVIVTQSTVAAVSHAAPLIALLRQHEAEVGLVVVGKGPYQPADVAAALGIGLLGSVSFDERSAASLCGEPGSIRQLSKSPLVRSCRALSERLQRILKVGNTEELAS